MQDKVFRFNPKKNEVRIRLVQEDDFGAEAGSLLLTFDCSPANYPFIKRVSAAIPNVRDKLTEKSSLDEVLNVIKDVFEIVLPGRFDEIFDFVGRDTENLKQVLAMVTEGIQSVGLGAKIDSIKPSAPDAE